MLAVHKCAVAAAGIFQQIAFVFFQDAGVTAGNAGVEQHQVVIALPPQREGRARNLNFALVAESVADRDVRKRAGHEIG